MTINLKMPDITELKPKITVFGVGGAGGNAVNNMINSGLEGVEFVVANTDAQALTSSKSERIIQMGLEVTEGLGAGSQPDVGKAAAEEVIDEINDYLSGSHMAFITAGMGGGTGTGAAPVVARAARDQGILTVGVVTKPFQFEGARRMRLAEAGIDDLQANVDTLIVIPNQNLFRIANEKTTFADAFSMADQVLYSGVACITDLMVKEGLINLDFADVRSVMREMGKAMMGTGEASGERRAIEAAEAAIANPLLDETSMHGAEGLLISITGGNDLTLFEVDEAATRIREEVDPDANIILGATFDETLEGVVRVSVVATGIDQNSARATTVKEAIAAKQAMATKAPEAKPIAQAAVASKPTAAEIEAELALPETTKQKSAETTVPAAQSIAPKAEPVAAAAKTDPGVTIKPFTPSPEAYELARKAADIPTVEDLEAPVTPAVVEEAPVPSEPYIPAAAERPVTTPKMPSVDDFPAVVREEIRAKTGAAPFHQAGVDQPDRGAKGLLQRIKSATIGTRDEHIAPPQQAAAPQRQARVQPGARSSIEQTPTSAFAKAPQAPKTSPNAPQGYAPATGQLDQHGRTKAPEATQASDDHLEIPAFLRRQVK